MTDSRLARRDLLRLAALAGLTAGCRSSGTSAPPTPPPTPSVAPVSPSPTASPTAARVVRFTPLAQESFPGLKRAAADVVQALTTRQPGQDLAEALSAARTHLSDGLDLTAAVRRAAPLSEGVQSQGTVLYPQLSGLDPLGPGARGAGVMVVVQQRVVSRTGAVSSVQRVCDLRLRLEEGRWAVTEVAGVGGEPVARPPDLDELAVRVLDDPRLELPDSCRWDVHAGRVDRALLRLLADSAAVARLSVTVLRTGHPPNVFATTRTSDHTRGRAVDIWRVGGRPVILGASGGPARAVLRRAFDDPGVRQTGSPVGTDADGGGRRSFTDLVHEDHLHLAVRAT